MAVEVVPQKYATSDGREFDAQEAAERHQRLLEARELYGEARRKLAVCMFETAFTADGKRFDFECLRHYYRVYRVWGEAPRLVELPYFGWNFDFREEDDMLQIRCQHGVEWYSAPVCELYDNERAAQDALSVTLARYIEELQKSLEAIRGR